jgi:osmoprotectant transport system substrate-binding protein
MTRRECLSGLLLLLVGCGGKSHRVVIGSKNFTEQLVLGELLAQLLERSARVAVERRFYLAGTYVCHQALLAGRIDAYVEYTGTALTAILRRPRAANPTEVYSVVRDEYACRYGVDVLRPLGFNNSFALVVRGDDARRSSLSTISQLAQHAPQWRIGVGYEFLERPDGYKGLVSTYDLHFKEAPRVMDLGLLYRAMESREVDIIVGSNTDGVIAAHDLAVLEDDRGYFPPYDAVPLVRREALEQFPAVGRTLNQLAGKISAVEMRRMNYAIVGQRRNARDVATEFLQTLSPGFSRTSGQFRTLTCG